MTQLLRAPHIVSVAVGGVLAEAVLLGLDRAGVAAHSGSACSSESIEPSPVLAAMGVDPDRSLRLSVGWSTTQADVEAFAAAFPVVVKRPARPSGSEPRLADLTTFGGGVPASLSPSRHRRQPLCSRPRIARRQGLAWRPRSPSARQGRPRQQVLRGSDSQRVTELDHRLCRPGEVLVEDRHPRAHARRDNQVRP